VLVHVTDQLVLDCFVHQVIVVVQNTCRSALNTATDHLSVDPLELVLTDPHPLNFFKTMKAPSQNLKQGVNNEKPRVPGNQRPQSNFI